MKRVVARNNQMEIVEDRRLRPRAGMRVIIQGRGRGRIGADFGVIKSVYSDGRCKVTVPVHSIRYNGVNEVLKTEDRVHSQNSLVAR